MRCSCKECGIYMVQADAPHLGCVCPECFYRCTDCLGTNTVVSREGLKSLAFDPRFKPENLAANFAPSEEESAPAESPWLTMTRQKQQWSFGPEKKDSHG